MQRSYGNRYTGRAIERSLTTANDTAVKGQVQRDSARAQATADEPRQDDLDQRQEQRGVGPSGAVRTMVPLSTVTRRPAPIPLRPTPETQTESPDRESDPREATESLVSRPSPAFAPPLVAAPDPSPVRAIAPSTPSGPVIQRNWLDDAADAVSDAASSVAGSVSSAARSAAHTVSDVVTDAASAVSDAAGAVSGLLASAVGGIKSAFDAVIGKISGAWDGVTTGVRKAAEAAMQGAFGFLGGFGSLFNAITSALMSLDAGALKAAWATVTGAVDAAVAGVRALAAQITATVDAMWTGLKGLAQGAIAGLRSQAEKLIGHLPGPIQGAARSAWATIEAQVTSTWRTIESGWTSLRASALKGITEVVGQVKSVAAAIKNAGVNTVIAAMEQGSAILAFVRQVMANPDIVIDPIVKTVVGLLQGVPEQSRAAVPGKVQERASGRAPGAAAPGTALTGAAPGSSVQRMPEPSPRLMIQRQGPAHDEAHTTLGIGKTVSGILQGIGDKLAALWADLGNQVKKMVIGVVDPRAIAKGIGEDWNGMTKELSVRAKRIEGVRTDSWGNFFEDLGRFISNILDFPLIVWRAINAMLGRLSVYMGLAIILGGAVMGAIAAGTGGAIFGSVIPAAGTAGGGVAGVLAGAWAGATAGYAAAESVGLVLLASFVIAEQLSTEKAIVDLVAIPQTEQEQEEDINQASDSIVAMITAGALLLIAWMAVSLAKMIFAFIKGIVVRVRGGEVAPPGAEPKPKPVDVPITKRGFSICRSCLTDAKTPPDLLARRQALPPEVGEFLDNNIKNNPNIFKDPANPTVADFKAAKGIMDGAERLGQTRLGPGKTPQEYLEAGLREQMPKVGLPIGDPAAIKELPRVDRAMRRVVQEIDDFAKANPDMQDASKMGDQLRSLLKGTFKDQLEGRQPITDPQVIGYDGQIKGAEGELAEARTAPTKTIFNATIDGVEFDQVRPDGTLFQTKSLRAARGPSAKFPDGNGTYKSAIAQVKRTLEIAERPANLHNGQPRKVIIKFREGLSKDVAADMRAVTSPQGQKATIIADEIVLDPL